MMDLLQNRSLEKIAGNSVIAWGVASFPLSLAMGVGICAAPFIVLAGIAVRRGSRTGSFFALIFSAIGFVGAVAIVVSAADHGIDEVGAWRAFAAASFAVWTLLNLAVLSQLWGRKPPGKLPRSGNGEAASPNESLLVPKTEAAGNDPGGVVFAPIATSHERFPQFSLRSLFVLAILVALACAIGTRPVELNRNWGNSWSTGQSGGSSGNVVAWTVFVASSDFGCPTIGYLWRSQGRRASSPTCFDAGNRNREFRVNGRAITPGRDFILFFNDAEDKPQRLEISKKEAMRIFGHSLDASRIEKFWRETIEPLRKRCGARTKSP